MKRVIGAMVSFWILFCLLMVPWSFTIGVEYLITYYGLDRITLLLIFMPFQLFFMLCFCVLTAIEMKKETK